MMLISGQSNRIWHYWAGKYPGSVGVLIGPSYGSKVPLDPWMPFVLDNDAFVAWKNKTEWDARAYTYFLERIHLTGLEPRWAAVPDVVGDMDGTIAKWHLWYPVIRSYGWPAAFCVQDGMTQQDVPHEAEVVFVGGTDKWKFRNLHRWTDNFSRVHCARVSSEKMLCACEEAGCESVDSTAWFREPSRPDKVPMLTRFVEGHRDKNMRLQLH